MFRRRSEKLELLDSENIPAKYLYQNLKELDIINHLLGGYKISFDALKNILKKGNTYTLVDIGCGGGDTLKRIAQWNRLKHYSLQLYGIDIKPVCIEYAHNNKPDNAINFICDDYKNMHHHLPIIDIIHACLFCHHLKEEQLVELVKFAEERNATLVINDLERNALAYYLIKWITALFSKSYLVKNDAPLSVARGFKKKEWEHIMSLADVKKYSIKNKWAFRHQVIVYAGNRE